MTVYDKDEAADLTPREMKALKSAIEAELQARQARRHVREKARRDTEMSKRNILGDLLEGVTAMKSQREGKLTLRSFKVEATPLPKVDSKLIRDMRRKCQQRERRARRVERLNPR